MIKQMSMEQFEGLDEMITTSSLEESKVVPVGSKEHILNLQLIMATTSVNHEYARIEFEETKHLERKEELTSYMTECRAKYDEARDELSCVNPLVVETFEAELALQKKTTMVHYHA